MSNSTKDKYTFHVGVGSSHATVTADTLQVAENGIVTLMLSGECVGYVPTGCSVTRGTKIE